MPKIDPRWAHVARDYRDLCISLTSELPHRLARRGGLGDALDAILDLITDQNPEESLSFSAAYPYPTFDTSLVRGPITPLQKWKKLKAAAPLWPTRTQKLARVLNIGGSTLPDWKAISRFCKNLGFEAVPVCGYVGVPLYGHLIRSRRIPICTRWALRYRVAPYFILPTDTFHDLGHAIALTRPEYRDGLIRLSEGVAKKTKSHRNSVTHQYGRLFEHSWILGPEGDIQPWGASSWMLENLDVKKGKWVSPLLKYRQPSQLKHGYRPHTSVQHWQEDLEKTLERFS